MTEELKNKQKQVEINKIKKMAKLK